MSASLEEIEPRNARRPNDLPLVLIHDGGGTIFQYFLLGPFDRRVFAINNPYFDSGGRPEGGIPELAREYARAIRASIAQGKIILGGWSFGGMLSVEVARLLETDPSVHVAGLILIDSTCPWSAGYRNRGRVRPSYRENTSQAIKDNVNRSFDNAREMIIEWDRPPAFEAPPAVMIRATDAMGIENSPDGVQSTSASDDRLGWSDYACIKFLSVVKVPGDHFSMFAEHRLGSMTQTIKEACTILQTPEP